MSSAPEVQISAGRLRGTLAAQGPVFRGVPYAAAPVGALRFAPPAPTPSWSGVRDAARPGPIAPQPERAIGALLGDGLPDADEDCLTVDVWTPALDGPPRPVLVWIHGGGFTVGYGSDPLCDGARLAAAADAVVVALNYRLGSLGWLAHPDLAAAAGAPAGNWGLLDQVAALRWVRDEIAAFGGDPGRVTLAGQSAGAISALDLLVVDAAEGLFHRLIAQSPLIGLCAGDPQTAHAWAQALARAAAGADSPAALRDVPAPAIVAAHERLLDDPRFAGGRGGAVPTLDPATLALSPEQRPQARPDIPVLIGSTADEGAFFFRAADRRVDPDDEALSAIVGRFAGADGDGDGALVAAYRARAVERGEPADNNSVLVAAATDGLVAVPAARWADERAAAGGTVHAYRVDHPSPLPGLGAMHCVDLPLVFGTYADGGAASRLVGDGPATAAVSEQMLRAWAAFVRGEDPGWPALDPDTGEPTTAVFGGAAPLQLQTGAAALDLAAAAAR